MKNWLIGIIIVIILIIVGSAAFILGQGNTTSDSNSTSSISETNEKEVFTKENAVNFINETLKNEKFGRHNLIWDSLDKPSQEVFGNVNDYEDFFNAVAVIQQEKRLKDFQIDTESIVLRESWTSPQGAKYFPVYDIPVERTLNDGTTESNTYYVFEVEGELEITTGFTAKLYKDTKKELVEAGYLESDE